MSHTLTNYNGVKIVTPQADLSADRQALNANFEFLANSIATLDENYVRNPMIGNLDAGGFEIGNIRAPIVGAKFNGSNFIQLPAATHIMPNDNDAWSVSVWIRTRSTSLYNAFAFWGSVAEYSGMTLLISKDWPGTNYQFALNVPSTNAIYGSTSGPLNDGNWHLCVATYVESTLTIYVDNVLQSLAFAVTPPPDWRGALTIANDPTIGTWIGRTFGSPPYFEGDLAEMYLWKDALSADDAAWLWNGGAGPWQPSLAEIVAEITDGTLLAGYHLNGSTDDFSENGNTGTWEGGASNATATALSVAQGTTSLDAGAIFTDGTGNLWLPNLPTSDPLSPGQLYTSSGVLMVSAG